MVTHSIELLTCAQYGCPGCDYRHFYRSSDSTYLTEVAGEGMFTGERLATIGRAALATGALDASTEGASVPRRDPSE